MSGIRTRENIAPSQSIVSPDMALISPFTIARVDPLSVPSPQTDTSAPVVVDPTPAPDQPADPTLIIPIPSDLPRTLAAEAAEAETRNLLSRFLRRQPARLRKIAEIAIRYDRGKEFFSDAIPLELEGILPNIVYTNRMRILNESLASFRSLKDYRPMIRTVSTTVGILAVLLVLILRALQIGPGGFAGQNGNGNGQGSNNGTGTMPSGGNNGTSALLSGIVFSAILMAVVVFCVMSRPFKPYEYVVLELKKWEEEDKPIRLVWRTHRATDVFSGSAFKPVQPPWTITIEQREPTEIEIAAREELIAAAGREGAPGLAPTAASEGARFVEVRDWNGALYLPKYEPPVNETSTPRSPSGSMSSTLAPSSSSSSVGGESTPEIVVTVSDGSASSPPTPHRSRGRSSSSSSPSIPLYPPAPTPIDADMDTVLIVTPYIQTLSAPPPRYGDVVRGRRGVSPARGSPFRGRFGSEGGMRLGRRSGSTLGVDRGVEMVRVSSASSLASSTTGANVTEAMSVTPAVPAGKPPAYGDAIGDGVSRGRDAS
ncbi:hypothetical protein HDU67_005011 [Dinochytrium kinnereticum]|nr:hypothetical protein HDU67_005011 [Dinochytrium kinnereticum]